MDCIGITANRGKNGASGFLERFVPALKKRGVSVVLDEDAGAHFQGERVAPFREMVAAADMVVVLGGDGTMLHSVHRMLPDLKPVIGVNVGTLGFLTFSTGDDPEETAEALVSGDYVISERRLLDGVVRRNGVEMAHFQALNEVTLKHENVARMISVEASVRGDVLNRYHADGLIVATPTGSTAYSMSAGGPVVSPRSEVIVITPICPHALSNRAVVVGDDETINLCGKGGEDGDTLVLAVDGHARIPITNADVLEVRLAEKPLPLVMRSDRSFYETLRLKLRWHGSNV